MLLTRERRPVPTRLLLPSSAPLPNLREALARRAEMFGPFDLDEAPARPRGVLAQCAAALRQAADLVEPRGLREAGGVTALKRS